MNSAKGNETSAANGSVSRIVLKKEPRLDAKRQAFSYQVEAFEAVRDRPYAAIFHEQGLGKTKIAIDLMLYWLSMKLVDTVLLVVKKGLLANWKRELEFHSYLKPRVLTQSHRTNFFVFNSPARVVLTHYEAVKGEKARMQLFLKARSVGTILDESTKIKNPDAELTRAFFDLATLFKRRVIMTGTPVANRPEDVWAQVWFLDQGASLGNDFASFQRDVELSNDLAHDADAQHAYEAALERTFAKIAPFSVRENKSSGIISLPEKVIRSIVTDWEPHQWELYRQVRDQMRAIVIREGVPTEDHAEAILKRLLRLVQIASNPALVDSGYKCEPGKLHHLKDLVGHIHDLREKAIVWTGFTENADWLCAELKGYGACRVHGKLSMDARNRSIDRFMTDDGVEILVATPGAAKEGLTLTVANHVVFYDRSFSLDDYLQAQDRIHRISQTKTCHVYNLIMRDSIDEWVDVLIHAKHMSAQLAQGDISIEYYQRQMTYDFGDVLRQVLGITDHNGGDTWPQVNG